MARLLKKLTVKEHIICAYNICRYGLKEQWREYLIVAAAPFVGLFLLYCMAALR